MERGSPLEREARDYARKTLLEHLREAERERRKATLAAFTAGAAAGKPVRDMGRNEYARFRAGFQRALIGGTPRSR